MKLDLNACFFGNWSQAYFTVHWCGGVKFFNVQFHSEDVSFHPSRHHYPRPTSLKYAIFNALMLLSVYLCYGFEDRNPIK
ncbi:hypothetical protein YC2023_112723 [Brassica napus]